MQLLIYIKKDTSHKTYFLDLCLQTHPPPPTPQVSGSKVNQCLESWWCKNVGLKLPRLNF